MSATSNINRIKTKRDTLLAYSIDGHMDAEDISSVYAQLLSTYKDHPKIDLLVKMTNFDGFDWSAIWSDTTYAAKTQSLKHIRRYAIVGAPTWIKTIIKVFDPMFHVEMKSFDLSQEDQAWAWLEEGAPKPISQS